MSYYGAEKYCEKQGMRIPSASELQSLYSSSRSWKDNPFGRNGVTVTGFDNGWYWSTTPSERNSYFMSTVNFTNNSVGMAMYDLDYSDYHHVRCVKTI
jgi:hypothetical protein